MLSDFFLIQSTARLLLSLLRRILLYILYHFLQNFVKILQFVHFQIALRSARILFPAFIILYIVYCFLPLASFLFLVFLNFHLFIKTPPLCPIRKKNEKLIENNRRYIFSLNNMNNINSVSPSSSYSSSFSSASPSRSFCSILVYAIVFTLLFVNIFTVSRCPYLFSQFCF